MYVDKRHPCNSLWLLRPTACVIQMSKSPPSPFFSGLSSLTQVSISSFTLTSACGSLALAGNKFCAHANSGHIEHFITSHSQPISDVDAYQMASSQLSYATVKPNLDSQPPPSSLAQLFPPMMSRACLDMGRLPSFELGVWERDKWTVYFLSIVFSSSFIFGVVVFKVCVQV